MLLSKSTNAGICSNKLWNQCISRETRKSWIQVTRITTHLSLSLSCCMWMFVRGNRKEFDGVSRTLSLKLEMLLISSYPLWLHWWYFPVDRQTSSWGLKALKVSFDWLWVSWVQAACHLWGITTKVMRTPMMYRKGHLDHNELLELHSLSLPFWLIFITITI